MSKCQFVQIEPGLLNCPICNRNHASNNPPEFVKRDCRAGNDTGGITFTATFVQKPVAPKKKGCNCGKGKSDNRSKAEKKADLLERVKKHRQS